MREDNNSALGKDTNTALYEKDKISRVGKEIVYGSLDNTNKIIKEIRAEYLESQETSSYLVTSENSEFKEGELNTAIDNSSNDILETTSIEVDDEITIDDITSFENGDVDDIGVDIDFDVASKDNALLTGVKINEGGNNKVSSSLSTATTTDIKPKGDKLLTVTKVFGAGIKVAKVTNKIGGGLVRFGKNLNIFDENGNVNSTQASANQLKTASKFIVRNTYKGARWGTRKINKKLMAKPVAKISKKIGEKTAKTTAKISAKLTAKGFKVIAKIINFLIQFLSKLIVKFISVLITSLPVALAVLLLMIIAVAVFTMFGAFNSKEGAEKFNQYIVETQQTLNEKIRSYTNEGYKTTGTYNGNAYINWQASLSTLQGLNNDIDGSDGEIWVLKQMNNDGVMYTITEKACDPYYRKEQTKSATVSYKYIYTNIEETVTAQNGMSATINKKEITGTEYTVSFSLDKDYSLIEYKPSVELMALGSPIEKKNGSSYSYTYKTNHTDAKSYSAEFQEGIETKILYAVDVGSIDDYKEWVINNSSTIKKFYDKEKISYNDATTNFLTKNVEEIIDSLYQSDSFWLGFNDMGIELSATAVGGEILDTGEHKGVLAYPTSTRKLSAGFPTYPSGKEHTGIDFPVPTGTPICSCADGEVILTKELTYSYGKYIVIKHILENGNTIYTLYAHNSALFVGVGDKVVQGQVIASSGSTGNSTGPHCHLSVLTSWSPQQYVQPLNYLE